MEKIALRYGLLTFLGLSVYFGLMLLLGLIHVIELRVLNAVIMFAGCLFAIRHAREHLRGFNYFQGMAVGALAGTVASVLFAVFGVLYLKVIDPEFIVSIQNHDLFGSYINVVTASIQIFMEGTGSAIVISLMIMQFYKVGQESTSGISVARD